MAPKPNVRQFLDSERGSIMMSVIVGLGLAVMFRKACKGYGCYIVRGPPPRDLDKYVYRQDGRCYKYTPVNTSCTA